MSETLKERLNSHSSAFEGLLSLIPARVYYDEGTKEQWRRKKSSKADAAAARKAKLDSGSSTTALDETHRRQAINRASVNSGNTEVGADGGDESDISVIFDDEGNEVRLDNHGNSDADIPVAAEPENKAVTGDCGPQTDQSSKLSKNQSARASASSEPTPVIHQKGLQAEPVCPTTSNEKQSEEPVSAVKNDSTDLDSRAANPVKRKGQPLRNSQKLQELSQKLAEKINASRFQRRAPGSGASNAPRNREELLAARKARAEAKRLRRKSDIDRAKAEIPLVQDPEHGEGAKNDEFIDISSYNEDAGMMFGEAKFKDGQKINERNEISESKKVKKRNAIDQLKFIEQKKQRLSELPEEKQEEISEKAKWSSAVLRSEGAQLRDNEKLLKKAVKRKLNKKLKSGHEWRDRAEKVAKGIAAREAKRDANLQARRDNKGKINKSKKKPSKKRAGF